MSTLVMSGDFDAFSVEEVLEVVGLSRQVMEIIFKRNEQPTGRIVLKVGRVLHAEASNVRPGRASLQRVLQSPGRSFEVRRLSDANQNTNQPIGSLVDLIQELQDAAMAIPGDTPDADIQRLENRINDLLVELRAVAERSESSVTVRLEALNEQIAQLSQAPAPTDPDIKTLLEQIKENSVTNQQAPRFAWYALIAICALQFLSLLVTMFLLGAS